MSKWINLLLKFLVVILLFSCTKIQDPVFKNIQGFQLTNLGMQKADISFEIVYNNPNNFGVSVKEAVIDMYVDSVYMGKFTQQQLVDVGKNADFAIPLTGSIEVAKALKLKLGNVLDKDVQLSANGNVRVGKAGVFVNQPLKYAGKHRLNLGI